MADSALAIQEGGTHYKEMKIQPVEYAMANGLNICEANVVKYISRHRRKGGLQDLEKAKHMIDLLIELEYKPEASNEEPVFKAPKKRMVIR